MRGGYRVVLPYVPVIAICVHTTISAIGVNNDNGLMVVYIYIYISIYVYMTRDNTPVDSI